jgi:hypothetical protein
MPYAVTLYAYIFVANISAFVIVARWVEPFGFVAIIAFGLVYAYLAILFGRWGVWKEESVVRAIRAKTLTHGCDYIQN